MKNPEIKNLKKVAGRLIKAVESKEKIIIFGDADLDGAASVVILKETIQSLGGQAPEIYFPDREEEGYGINEKALNYFKKQTPALLISLDCGIGNFKEVKTAKKLGFEVIIIDHHEVLGKIPDASIVVDPKQEGDEYPFKKLATAGIVFKLSQVIFGEKFSETLKKSFLELVALATIADMMPQEEENKDFIEEGLNSLKNSFRPGLRAFWEVDPVEKIWHAPRRRRGALVDESQPNFFYEVDGIGEEDKLRQVSQKVISVLNISERKNHLNKTFLLLVCPDIEKAKEIIKKLLEKSGKRLERIKEITQEIEERILMKAEDVIIFEGGPEWPLGLLGSVASRICRTYQKPVFLFKKGKDLSRGAVRMPKDYNGVEAMSGCSEILETYGGHPPAAGFTIKNSNLEKFRECLIEYFSEK